MKKLLLILAAVLITLVIASLPIALNTAYMAGVRDGSIPAYVGWIVLIIGMAALGEVIEHFNPAR